MEEPEDKEPPVPEQEPDWKQRVMQRVRSQKGPSPRTSWIAAGVLVVAGVVVLSWMNRGPEEKLPVAKVATATPVLKSIHQMIHWNVPLDSMHKLLIVVDRTGSDTIPAFDGADILWSVPNKNLVYSVTTPRGTFVCQGEVCVDLPDGPAWVTFSSSTPDTIWFWYEKQPFKK